MSNRRQFVQRAGLAGLSLSLYPSARASVPAGAELDSDLIYVSPVKSNGSLSSCQAEVWFGAVGETLYVVTASDAWRAQAVARGLTRAQVWVGDVGEWDDADGRYRQLPGGIAQASMVDDPTRQRPALDAMGRKYRTSGWSSWGPRFDKGLADGSRVMIAYRLG